MKLTIPCILYLIITILLLYNTYFLYDKIILSIMILGQLLLLYGSIYNYNNIIEISHILYFLTITLGAILFKDIKNKLFILFILLITIFTRYYYKDCLFYISNNNTKLIDIDINFNIIYIILLIIIIYKCVYI